jgi:hypothetical protein
MSRERRGCSGHQRLVAASRRDFLRVGSLALGGLTLGQFLRIRSAQAEQKWYESKEHTAKSVIQIVCGGGIAAQESWNPKPESPLEYRGPFGVVKTSVPGIVMSETMPACAAIADKMCIIRSVVGSIPDHGQAMYHMLSGYKPSPAIKHPGMGAVVSHEFGPRGGLPAYIAVPDTVWDGAGTGYLSPKYGPFSLGGEPGQGNSYQVRDLSLPAGIDDAMFDTRRGLRDIVEAEFKRLEVDSAPLEAMDSFYQQAYTMMSSEAVREAFDLSKEPDAIKEAYGLGRFRSQGEIGKPLGASMGMRCLLARRLVEAGARFITINMGVSWDTHERLREAYQTNMPALDNAIATLIRDLDDRGLLDSTLVWVASEFGRTPKVTPAAGRDHWARVFSIAMAGGGLKRGLFYGDSDATSSEPSHDPVPLHDLHTTMYHLIGINSDKELMAPGDRPIEIVDGGRVVKDLIA